ncbi:hypothetical protein [Nitrospira sp. Nam74]
MMPLMLLIFFAVTAPFASGNDQFFRCDDGTFTNRADLLCAPYEPRGTVMAAPEGGRRANLAPFFEQNGPAVPPVVATTPEALTATPDACALYQEWTMLNLQTGGGVTFRNTQDVPRWQSLSRMFTAIGRPPCE